MRDPRALPEKKYFKIGEVADLVGVEPHVLRYWETQFPQVRPHKARSGHRLYRRREVETLLVIRELLHVQRFTIAGARQALRQPGGAQSLLPRFFDGPAHPVHPARPPEGATTLVPGPVDATDEDAALASDSGDVGEVALFSHTGADSAEGEMVEVEARALEDDELRDALEREAAGPDGAVVEVVASSLRPVSLKPGSVKPVSVRAVAEAAPRVERVERIVYRPTVSAARRLLLEEALGSARAVLAVLDREDSRSSVAERTAHA